MTPSFAITEDRPQTPKAVVTRLNSPSLSQVNLSSSEHSGSTSEYKAETPDSAVVIGKIAVVETLLTPPPPALLRPTNDIVRGKSSNNSLSGHSVDEGRRLTPRPTGMEGRQSSRHVGSTSTGSSARRKPRMEGISAQESIAPLSH